MSCHSLYKGSEQLPELPWEHCLAMRGTSASHTPRNVWLCSLPSNAAVCLWRNCWWITLLGQEQVWIYWRDVARCNSPNFAPESLRCDMHCLILGHTAHTWLWGCPQQPLKFTGKRGSACVPPFCIGVPQVGQDVEIIVLERNSTNAKVFPTLTTSRIPLFCSSAKVLWICWELISCWVHVLKVGHIKEILWWYFA